MKWRWALAVAIFFFLSREARAQRDYRREAAQLKQAFDRYHYEPPPYDDSFSEEVWESVLQKLDPSHLYFNEMDISALTEFRTTLDDEWRGNGWFFLNRLTEVYKNALQRGQGYLEAEGSREMSWKTPERFVPEEKKMVWPQNEREQRQRWRWWIKYKMLVAAREHALNDSVASVTEQSLIRRDADLRKKVVMEETRRTKGMRENAATLGNYVASSYFRSISTCYDPHSLYFSPRDFENFQASMSTKEYAFGIELSVDPEGNIVLSALLPGGPAWKSGELHPGDIFLEVKLGDQPAVDLRGVGLETFLEMLDENTAPTMGLTVKGSNGLKKTVTLQREKIDTQDNSVKGFVLSGKKKIGYISLPGFYTKWGPDERSSSNDVAAEIIKLKGESIDGLILDIRTNGGGSLFEAIEMIGIFIDQGPLAIIRQRGGKIVTLRDLYRGTAYDGPLTILLDGESASASEILAAAIQDYHRGIIVGGESFGKATGQVVISLDSVGEKAAEPSGGSGFVTVTDVKIYRVTGKSNQGVGVTPDVRLPDLHQASLFHEIVLPHAFGRDSLDKKTLFAALPVFSFGTLKGKSAQRIRDEPAFGAIESLATQLTTEERETTDTVTLDPAHFVPLTDAAIAKILRRAPTIPFEVHSPEFNHLLIDNDAYTKKINDQWIKNLKQDPYVREAFRITNDYIEQLSVK